MELVNRKGGKTMSLFPAVFENIGKALEKGDYLSVRKTDSDRIVAKAKRGGVKMSKTFYNTGKVVETKSYNI